MKCPACGAPVDLFQGQSTLKCAYCQSTIEVPVVTRKPVPAPHPYNPITGEILALVRSGERIKAINLVREYTGNTSLSEAADIVDAVARGEQVDL